MFEEVIEAIFSLHLVGKGDSGTIRKVCTRFGMRSEFSEFFMGIRDILSCQIGEEPKILKILKENVHMFESISEVDQVNRFLKALEEDVSFFLEVLKIVDEYNRDVNEFELGDLQGQFQTDLLSFKYFNLAILMMLKNRSTIRLRNEDFGEFYNACFGKHVDRMRTIKNKLALHKLAFSYRSLHDLLFNVCVFSTSVHAKRNHTSYFVENDKFIHKHVNGERTTLFSFPHYSSRIFVELGDEYAIVQDPEFRKHYLLYHNGVEVFNFRALSLRYIGSHFFLVTKESNTYLYYLSTPLKEENELNRLRRFRYKNADVDVVDGGFLFIKEKLYYHQRTRVGKDESHVITATYKQYFEVMKKLEHSRVEDFNDFIVCLNNENDGMFYFDVLAQEEVSLSQFSRPYRNLVMFLKNLNMDEDSMFSRIPQDVLIYKILPFINQIDVLKCSDRMKPVKKILKMKKLMLQHKNNQKPNRFEPIMEKYFHPHSICHTTKTISETIKTIYYLRYLRIKADPCDIFDKLVSYNFRDDELTLNDEFQTILINLLRLECIQNDYVKKKVIKEVFCFLLHLQQLETEISYISPDIVFRNVDEKLRRIIDMFCQSRNYVEEVIYGLFTKNQNVVINNNQRYLGLKFYFFLNLVENKVGMSYDLSNHFSDQRELVGLLEKIIEMDDVESKHGVISILGGQEYETIRIMEILKNYHHQFTTNGNEISSIMKKKLKRLVLKIMELSDETTKKLIADYLSTNFYFFTNEQSEEEGIMIGVPMCHIISNIFALSSENPFQTLCQNEDFLRILRPMILEEYEYGINDQYSNDFLKKLQNRQIVAIRELVHLFNEALVRHQPPVNLILKTEDSVSEDHLFSLCELTRFFISVFVIEGDDEFDEDDEISTRRTSIPPKYRDESVLSICKFLGQLGDLVERKELVKEWPVFEELNSTKEKIVICILKIIKMLVRKFDILKQPNEENVFVDRSTSHFLKIFCSCRKVCDVFEKLCESRESDLPFSSFNERIGEAGVLLEKEEKRGEVRKEKNQEKDRGIGRIVKVKKY